MCIFSDTSHTRILAAFYTHVICLQRTWAAFTHHEICLSVSQAQLCQWSWPCPAELRLPWCMPRRLGHGEHGWGWLLGRTMELLAICYSGSESITSANEPHAEFLRLSSVRSVSFCVCKDYRLCHLQSQTEAMLWPTFVFIFFSLYWEGL